jgi:HAD superfamily hydrolase (TIGR01509 family)
MERALRGVILDVDGTLLLSNDAHAQSWVDTFREFGMDIPFAKVRPLIGMGGDKLLPAAAGIDHESPSGKALSKRRTDIFNESYLDRLQPTPGARDLVQRLLDDGLKIVVATSAREEEMKKLLRRAGVDDLIDDATSASDAESSKPDPDIVEAAIELVGLPAEELVMIGDTPYDIEAATRAGVPLIAVRTGGWDDKSLRGALAIYDDPRELLLHYGDSPLARARASASST